MAVRIRMKRTGGTNNSCYRVVVMDQCAQRDGKAIEEIGFYNPNSKVETLKVDRYDYWLSVGAQASDTVKSVANRVKTISAWLILSASPRSPRKPRPRLKPKPRPKQKPKLLPLQLLKLRPKKLPLKRKLSAAA